MEKPIMRITRFNHVGLNGNGMLDELKEFYSSFLGLKEFERTGVAKLVNGFWAGMDVPIVHMVTDPPANGLEMPNDTHLSFYVDNINEAVALVKTRHDAILHVGEGIDQIIWFKDPAGNTLEFQQDRDIPLQAFE